MLWTVSGSSPVSCTTFNHGYLFLELITVRRTNRLMEIWKCSREHGMWLKRSFYLALRAEPATYNLAPFMWDGVVNMLLYGLPSKGPWRTTCSDCHFWLRTLPPTGWGSGLIHYTIEIRALPWKDRRTRTVNATWYAVAKGLGVRAECSAVRENDMNCVPFTSRNIM